MQRRRRLETAAVDSTGLECSCASGYFVRRRKSVGSPWETVVYHHFPKLAVLCDVADHCIFAYKARRGPKPDVAEFRGLLGEAIRRVRITRIVAGAGYDAEGNHRFARQECGVRTVIPARHGRPSGRPATGRYRRLMQVRFDRIAIGIFICVVNYRKAKEYSQKAKDYRIALARYKSERERLLKG